jgi:hypothetical protein
VLVCLFNQVLQFLDLLFVGLFNAFDVEVSLLAQVPFGNQAGGELIHFVDKVAVQVNLQVLSLLKHVVDTLHVLADVLVVVVVVLLLQESLHLQLVLQLQVQHLGLLPQLHVDVNILTGVQCFVQHVELVSLNGLLQLFLVLLDLLDNCQRPAD